MCVQRQEYRCYFHHYVSLIHSTFPLLAISQPGTWCTVQFQVSSTIYLFWDRLTWVSHARYDCKVSYYLMFCSLLISCCFLPPDVNYLNGTLSEEVIKLSDLTILSIGTSTSLLVAFVVVCIWPFVSSLPVLAAQNFLNGTLTTQLGQMTNFQSLLLRKSNHSRSRTMRTLSGPCPHSTPFKTLLLHRTKQLWWIHSHWTWPTYEYRIPLFRYDELWYEQSSSFWIALPAKLT